MNKFGLLVCIAVFVLAAASLLTGASYLEWLLPGGIPLGNLLVWAGMVAGAATGFSAKSPGRLLRVLTKAAVLLAVLWFPLGWLLAGNPNLNFNGGTPDEVFHLYTLASVAAVLIVLVCSGWNAWRIRLNSRKPHS